MKTISCPHCDCEDLALASAPQCKDLLVCMGCGATMQLQIVPLVARERANPPMTVPAY